MYGKYGIGYNMFPVMFAPCPQAAWPALSVKLHANVPTSPVELVVSVLIELTFGTNSEHICFLAYSQRNPSVLNKDDSACALNPTAQYVYILTFI